MEVGSNKSLYTFIAVVVFGIFLSLSYFLFQDNLKGVLADVMDNAGETTSLKLDNNGLIPNPASDFAITENNDGTLTVTDYLGSTKDVVIPAYINGKPVTKIGDFAFEFAMLTSVVIPETVLELGNSSFRENALTSITIPNSVTTIRWRAFDQNDLTYVYIPDSVTRLEGAAFCVNKLTSVRISESITHLESWTFGANELTSIVIPSNITFIGDYAFYGNKLTSVKLPENLTYLSGYTFTYNPLSEIKAPLSMKNIFDLDTFNLVKTMGNNPPTDFYDKSLITYY